MKTVIDSLLELQGLLTPGAKSAPSRAERLEALRKEIPESFLLTFDRFVARGKRPVATVRHGVCGDCHLQIAVGILGALTFGQGVQQCGNCGRFLYLPEDEPVVSREAATPAKPKIRRARKEPAAPSV